MSLGRQKCLDIEIVAGDPSLLIYSSLFTKVLPNQKHLLTPRFNPELTAGLCVIEYFIVSLKKTHQFKFHSCRILAQ